MKSLVSNRFAFALQAPWACLSLVLVSACSSTPKPNAASTSEVTAALRSNLSASEQGMIKATLATLGHQYEKSFGVRPDTKDVERSNACSLATIDAMSAEGSEIRSPDGTLNTQRLAQEIPLVVRSCNVESDIFRNATCVSPKTYAAFQATQVARMAEGELAGERATQFAECVKRELQPERGSLGKICERMPQAVFQAPPANAEEARLATNFGEHVRDTLIQCDPSSEKKVASKYLAASLTSQVVGIRQQTLAQWGVLVPENDASGFIDCATQVNLDYFNGEGKNKTIAEANMDLNAKLITCRATTGFYEGAKCQDLGRFARSLTKVSMAGLEDGMKGLAEAKRVAARQCLNDALEKEALSFAKPFCGERVFCIDLDPKSELCREMQTFEKNFEQFVNDNMHCLE